MCSIGFALQRFGLFQIGNHFTDEKGNEYFVDFVSVCIFPC